MQAFAFTFHGSDAKKHVITLSLLIINYLLVVNYQKVVGS